MTLLRTEVAAGSLSGPSSAVSVVAAAEHAQQLAAGGEQPAFISVLTSAQRAALEVEAAGDAPLAGLAFAVKDNIDVAGVATTAACPALTSPATQSAEVVRRLMAAGATPIGKTNMDQFATGLVGTRSPYGACHSIASRTHLSGGSSSGSAIAVAAGVVPFALGTDTAGSGRVPAAFNGLVGMKPSRGLISVRGLLPASPSLDCISIFARDVTLARRVFEVAVGPDARDARSRRLPALAPAGVARHLRVVGVPSSPLDLDDQHRAAWDRAMAELATRVQVVPVDVSAFLETARLLYNGPFVAERLSAFGEFLDEDGPHLDPVVRRIVLSARRLSAAEVFTGQQRLVELRRTAMAAYVGVDAIALPVTPFHPTFADVAADPVGVNSRLGTYTNMVNLLDLCAIALPAGTRPDGLPFGYQLLAPAFADRPLLDLAARLLDEPACEGITDSGAVAAGHALLAVSGAHLHGQPLNDMLVRLGGRLHSRARTASGYRMYRVPGPIPRPGLVFTGDGPAEGLEVEVWEVPRAGIGELLPSIDPPLALGRLRLDDGSDVIGFVADGSRLGAPEDITDSGGWRAYLASAAGQVAPG